MEEQKDSSLINIFLLLEKLNGHLTKEIITDEKKALEIYQLGQMLAKGCVAIGTLPLVQKIQWLYTLMLVIRVLEKAGYRNNETYQLLATLRQYFTQLPEKNGQQFDEWRKIHAALPLLQGHYTRTTTGNRALPTAGQALSAPYAQLLETLDDYHEALARTENGSAFLMQSITEESVTQLARLEACFLYDRSHAAIKNLSAETGNHIENLLWQSGESFWAMRWIYERYILQAPSLDLLNRYLQIYLGEESQEKLIPDWKCHQQLLKQHRNTLQQEIEKNPRQAIMNFNHHIQQFVRQLWQESESLLGEVPSLCAYGETQATPVQFCVLAVGSMARENLSVSSDLELVVLVSYRGDANMEKASAAGAEWQKRAWYMKILLEIFEFKVRNLGETGTGLCLDNANQPRTEPAVFDTPEGIWEKCLKSVAGDISAADGLIYSLLHAGYLYGDKTLYARFARKRQEVLATRCLREDAKNLAGALQRPMPEEALKWHRYWALAQFQRNVKENYAPYVGGQVQASLKAPYLKLLNFLLFDLALYDNVEVFNIQEACEYLGKNGALLPLSYYQEIEKTILWLLTQRNRVHLLRGREDDTPLPEHQSRLQEIEQQLLTPFYQNLPLWWEENRSCFYQACWMNILQQQLRENAAAIGNIKLMDRRYPETVHLPEEWFNKLKDFFPRENTPNKMLALDPEYALVFLDAPTISAQHYALDCLARLLHLPEVPPGCAVRLFDAGKKYEGWLFSPAGKFSPLAYHRGLLTALAGLIHPAKNFAHPWLATSGDGEDLPAETISRWLQQSLPQWRIGAVLKKWAEYLQFYPESSQAYLDGIQQIEDLLRQMQQHQQQQFGLNSENFEVLPAKSIAASLRESDFMLVRQSQSLSATGQSLARHGKFAEKPQAVKPLPAQPPRLWLLLAKKTLEWLEVVTGVLEKNAANKESAQLLAAKNIARALQAMAGNRWEELLLNPAFFQIDQNAFPALKKYAEQCALLAVAAEKEKEFYLSSAHYFNAGKIDELRVWANKTVAEDIVIEKPVVAQTNANDKRCLVS